ncbi:SDR family NAD(P)-dependent oxidoreductase [Halopseudomonas pelagia]|uniref:SDR family NAD(P)-dependent oxidoreductase n=1 Tax=Halopseudomonas pelagia TaxID=553151 RepID=UPI001C542D55|nr:SDR family NAD(P)-dependent oxidoreductase [Halopseudomonas pelagia]
MSWGRVKATDLANARAEFMRHDVTQEVEWVAAVEATIKRFGGLDILVNNAGIETSALVTECELEDS